MYKAIYFDSLGIVTSKDFDAKADAMAFAATKDWAVVVKYTDSRTITTQT